MGGNAVKKTESSLFMDSVFFQSWKKQSPQKVTFHGLCFLPELKKKSPRKVRTLVFFIAFPPMSETFFFRAEMFGLI